MGLSSLHNSGAVGELLDAAAQCSDKIAFDGAFKTVPAVVPGTLQSVQGGSEIDVALAGQAAVVVGQVDMAQPRAGLLQGGERCGLRDVHVVEIGHCAGLGAGGQCAPGTWSAIEIQASRSGCISRTHSSRPASSLRRFDSVSRIAR